MNTTTELIATNVGWLRQALSLLGQIDDVVYTSCPQGLASHRVGNHLRHILEFYECFLDGIEASRIDYDARKRDELVEKRRHVAADKACTVMRRLEENPKLREDALVSVRMENAGAGKSQDPYLQSSIGRELQALSSHTIHHFALIAVTLKAHGFEVDPEFGMSPSTLRYQATQTLASEEAA